MSYVNDLIKEGKYNNKLPFVSHKKDPEAYNSYRQETDKLIDLFNQDLEEDCGTSNLIGKEKLFAFAWAEGHPGGLHEVADIYAEFTHLVLEIVEANK